MKNTIFNRLYSIILISSISAMVAFVLGANAETEAVKFNYILFIGFCEILVILSIIILFFTKSK
jgi:hypothetical protein